jgi:hypothetical protein
MDDMQRITRWAEWLERDVAPDTTSLTETDRRLLRMLLSIRRSERPPWPTSGVGVHLKH